MTHPTDLSHASEVGPFRSCTRSQLKLSAFVLLRYKSCARFRARATVGASGDILQIMSGGGGGGGGWGGGGGGE